MSTDTANPAGSTPERSDRFPAGIPYIVGNEGAERFSYYGMRAILYVYLGTLFAHTLTAEQVASGEAKAQATAVAHLFMAGVYAFPMIGAILADRWKGKYPVILMVSLIYCAGHAVLALAGRFDAWQDYDSALYLMYAGLCLIAVGSGGIKPCVSANVGDQFTAKNSHLVTTVFQIFYFIINFGSFFSTMLTPMLYKTLGPEVAFGVPGIFMGIATVVFYLGRDKFVHVPPNPGGGLGRHDFLASVLLFAPVIALILSVFVVGAHFEPSELGDRGKAEYCFDFVVNYASYLIANSWHYFAIAFGLVGVGLALFAARQKKARDNGFLAVTLYAWQHRAQRKEGQGFFDVAADEFGPEAAEGPPAVLRIALVFSMVSVFWALFDQHASTWIEQAASMDLSVTLPYYSAHFFLQSDFYFMQLLPGYGLVALALFGGFWLFSWISNNPVSSKVTKGYFAVVGVAGLLAIVGDATRGEDITITLQASQIQGLNPLLVMMIIPGLNALVYGPLDKAGRPLRPLQKMTIGMFMAAAAFLIAALLQERVEAGVAAGEPVHVLWQIMQYIVMTTSEVLVSVTGLEFAYTQAPRAMKSTIMGFWLLGVTFGNVLVAFLAPVQTVLALSQFFWLFTAVMTVAAMIFAVMAYFYKGKSYLQSEA